MNWTVRKRLAAQSLFGAGLIAAVGITAWTGVRAAERAGQQATAGARAIRQQLDIQMMHDALLADAFSATTTSDHAQRRSAILTSQRHSAQLLSGLQALAALRLNAMTRTALDATRPMLQRYATEVNAIVAHAADGSSANTIPSELAQLREDHDALEASLARVNSELDAFTTAAEQTTAAVATTQRWVDIIVPLFAMAALLWAAHLVRRGITRPLDRAVAVLDAVSRGDLRERLETGADDELGRMASAVNRALDSLTQTMSGLSRNAGAVSAASEELAAVSQQLTSGAQETASQMTRASSAAEQVSSSVRLVAVSAQQVGSSIREVAQSAQEAAIVARTAVQVAARASEVMDKLGVSGKQIESVVRAITAIAEQTNILALNAEIEAARAGDAGKGFAVVASEVKELARETSHATGDISRRVEAIRADSREAIATLAGIVDIVQSIHATQDIIASAVQEQNAATAEITRSMGEASRGAGEIAAMIALVARATESTTAGAKETQTAANELAMMATELERLVHPFHYTAAPGRTTGIAAQDAPLRRAA